MFEWFGGLATAGILGENYFETHFNPLSPGKGNCLAGESLEAERQSINTLNKYVAVSTYYGTARKVHRELLSLVATLSSLFQFHPYS